MVETKKNGEEHEKRDFTVLLVDPNKDYRDQLRLILQGENCKVIEAESLDKIIEHLDKGNLLVTADTADLSQVRAKSETLPILGVAPLDSLSNLMSGGSFTEVLPPFPDYLIRRVNYYRSVAADKTIAGLFPHSPEPFIQAMLSDLDKGRIEQGLKKMYFLGEEFPGEKSVSKAMSQFLLKIAKEGWKVPGIEFNAVSTDSIYNAHGHPLLVQISGNCIKRYFDKRRAKCDLAALLELDKRDQDQTLESSDELGLLHSMKTRINTVKLKHKELVVEDEKLAEGHGEIYTFMGLVRGPNLNCIASELNAAKFNGDLFAKHFERAVRFVMNEYVSALQANPIALPGVKSETQEYVHSIRKVFEHTFPYLKIDASPDEHIALRLAVRSFFAPLMNYSPVQYFDMSAKNMMFEIEGAHNSTFEDIRRHFNKWRGNDDPNIGIEEVSAYVKKIMRKIDWNKIYRMSHPADDACHEISSIPISLNDDSPALDLHMWLIKEKEQLVNAQIEKVKKSADYHFPSPEFNTSFSQISRLEQLACDLAVGKISLPDARKKALRYFSPDALREFKEYETAVPAAWLYRAMRTVEFSLLTGRPVNTKDGVNARRRMNACYFNKDAKKQIENGKSGWALEEQIARYIQKVDNPDRRPFTGCVLFKPVTLDGGASLFKEGKVEEYVIAANAYFQSRSNQEALKGEIGFSFWRMETLLDNVICKHSAKMKNKTARFLDAVNDPKKYSGVLHGILRDSKESFDVKQYAGALYLRKFLDKIYSGIGGKPGYVPGSAQK